MKNLKKVPVYTISSLFAAGIVPVALADEPAQEPVDSKLDNAKSIANDIADQQIYTLAQHQSHSSHTSHGSHSSHSSHSSSSSMTTVLDSPAVVAGEENSESESAYFSRDRNERSTPRSTVLPSTPAINKTKKLIRLPGNSTKFEDTVKSMQLALTSLGYVVGNLSGELDARTIAAIYEYQEASGYLPTGILTPETLSNLNIVVQ